MQFCSGSDWVVDNLCNLTDSRIDFLFLTPEGKNVYHSAVLPVLILHLHLAASNKIIAELIKSAICQWSNSLESANAVALLTCKIFTSINKRQLKMIFLVYQRQSNNSISFTCLPGSISSTVFDLFNPLLGFARLKPVFLNFGSLLEVWTL